MSIKMGSLSIASVYGGTQEIASIYKGTTLVYETAEAVTVSGILPLVLQGCKNANVVNYKISGNSTQSSTPSPSSFVDVESVGDLVTDTSDDNYGKYKIPVLVGKGNTTTTTNIYLDAPLRKVGDLSDYIDFSSQQVVRNINSLTLTGQEDWKNLSNNRVYLEVSNKKYSINVLCNAYPYGDGLNPGVAGRSNNKTIVFKDSNIITSVANWKSYLATQYANDEPVIVYYQLNTAVRESVILPNVLLNEGMNIVNVGTSVVPSGMLVKYKGSVETIPDEYQQVEYLGSSGTQYINTGVLCDHNAGCKMIFQFTNTNILTQYAIGVLDAGVARFNPLFIDRGTTQYEGFLYSNSISFSAYEYTNNRDQNIHNLSFNTTLDREIKFDGSDYGTVNNNGDSVSATIYLFARNYGGASHNATMRIYKTEMYSSGVKIRNLIPCYRKLDNVAGMYDTVNDVFYTNSGSGTFAVGNNVN